MIAKIMAPKASFGGVYYNERKNEQGRSELLTAANFSFLDHANHTKADYIKYMEMVCRTNTNVSNVQFHATISCKGREYSPDQLNDIAVQYVQKMGYGECPYLIYYHSDTDNNHVHIVSTRVDKQGGRVNDSNERRRSQAVINEIMQINVPLKAEQDAGSALEYNISSVNQYKLLLEAQGWGVYTKDGLISLAKGGSVQYFFPEQQVIDRIRQFRAQEQRAKQLTAIFHKYKPGLNHHQLKTLLKDKFGIDLIFHVGKGHTTPYGYTIIDHPNKSVYKGGDVMDLKDILMTPERQEKINSVDELIGGVISIPGSRLDVGSFRDKMGQFGYRVSPDGRIGLKAEKSYLLKLDDNILKELRYNSRVGEANTFNVSTPAEAKILSRLYFVRAEDVQVSHAAKNYDTSLGYDQIMRGHIANSSDLSTDLKERGIRFVSDGRELYLIDTHNREIYGSRELGVDRAMYEGRVEITGLSDVERLGAEVEKSADISPGAILLDTILNAANQNYRQEQDRRRRKKKGNELK